MADILGRHPDVFMCPHKEARFFVYSPDSKRDYIRRTPYKTLEEYEEAFNQAGEAKAIGEATPIYYCSGEALRKIKELMPQVRLIMIVRNPADKAFSEAQMHYRGGTLTRSEFKDFHEVPRMLNASLYADDFRECARLFPGEQLKLFVFEELVAEPQKVVRELCDFLDIDAAPALTQFPHSNRGGVPQNRLAVLVSRVAGAISGRRLLPRPLINALSRFIKPLVYRKVRLDPKVRMKLLQHFTADIRELERLSGVPVSEHWLGGVAGDPGQ